MYRPACVRTWVPHGGGRKHADAAGVPWGAWQPLHGQTGRAGCVWLFPSEKASKAEFYLDVQWVFKHVEPSEFAGK